MVKSQNNTIIVLYGCHQPKTRCLGLERNGRRLQITAHTVQPLPPVIISSSSSLLLSTSSSQPHFEFDHNCTAAPITSPASMAACKSPSLCYGVHVSTLNRLCIFTQSHVLAFWVIFYGSMFIIGLIIRRAFWCSSRFWSCIWIFVTR